jgi:ABC-type lipoprotein export system ATPase subunit/bifunctional DNA-binding transcriptional regulator/antitoxin component of YhaV-PrlF toxin-antitoxin module
MSMSEQPSSSQKPQASAAQALPAVDIDPTAAIVCDNLVKIYKVAELEVFALQGLDLVIQRGELLGIVGASGSGKSTLMNILGGLDRPSAGRAWVDGQDLLKLNDAGLDQYRRSKVGFVWQQGGRNLIPYLNAIENVELPMTLAGEFGGNKRKRAEDLLDRVGLGTRKFHRLSELSGGEQQRVSIAVALANNPRLLLADEPTGELDSNTALAIYKTFQDLNTQLGLTILIVSHDPTIARHVHRVVAIRDGKLSTETVRQNRTNGSAAAGEAHEEEAEEEAMQELIVLDSAGRLQIPKDIRQKASIKTRVTLEVTDDGVLIRPAGEDDRAPSAEVLGAALAASKKPALARLPGYQAVLNQVLRRLKPRRKEEKSS